MSPTYLDELAALSPLLERAAHLVRGEVEGGVARSDVLLDRLDAGAVALLKSLDGLEHHLPREGDRAVGQGKILRVTRTSPGHELGALPPPKTPTLLELANSSNEKDPPLRQEHRIKEDTQLENYVSPPPRIGNTTTTKEEPSPHLIVRRHGCCLGLVTGLLRSGREGRHITRGARANQRSSK